MDVDIDNVAAIVSRDYCDVMHDAIEWMRQQFTPVQQANVVALSPAQRVEGQAAKVTRITHHIGKPSRYFT